MTLFDLRHTMARYFDISDLIRFARKNRAVSGIQRVQLHLLRALAAREGGQDVFCVFATHRHGLLRVCRARELLEAYDLDPVMLLLRLGIERPARAFSQQELQEYLAGYRKHSLGRALRKASLQLLGMMAPHHARRRMGLPMRTPGLGYGAESVQLRTISRLSDADELILMGTSLNFSGIERLARRHARRGGCVVQVVYDLLPYTHPEYFVPDVVRKFAHFLARATTFTSCFVCISSATREALRRYMGEHGITAQTHVWPLPHEFEGYPRNAQTAVPTRQPVVEILAQPFVLCVGTLEVRKNGIMLLRTWQRLLAEMGPRTPQLVFAGKHGWKIDDFLELMRSDPALASRVTIVHHASDHDVAALYQRCLFTVFPSLGEGWGLPVGEAAWFGKYSIASATSSLPEVCGGLVDYIDPADLEDIVNAVRRGIVDIDYRCGRERAISTAVLRTWQDAGDSFHTLLCLNRTAQG